jgi:hypothetical protein
MAGFFDKLKKRMFDSKSDKNWLKDLNKTAKKPSPAPPRLSSSTNNKGTAAGRKSYFVQVGLDLGTSFTKVICRDVIMEKPWVHLPTRVCNRELPFLISSSLSFNQGVFSHPSSANLTDATGLLEQVKIALQRVSLGNLNDSVLANFRTVLPDGESLPDFVEMCAVYLLAGVLSGVRVDVAKRFPGSLPDDQIRVNLAIPVADANEPKVDRVFLRTLRHAWALSEELVGFPHITFDQLKQRVQSCKLRAKSDNIRDACNTYPEIGAAVQGFIRSRASSPGLYLFSDTGAGTVDQSVFEFIRSDNNAERLKFFSAHVLDQGSSHIEKLALEASGKSGLKALLEFREMKERGANDPYITYARKKIGSELAPLTKKVIALAKQKLTDRRRINELKVIFGGGGHSINPYAVRVLEQFDSDIFREDLIRDRRREEPNFDRGMPDLQYEFNFGSGKERWSRRLSVAYGLSFVHGGVDGTEGALVPYVLPCDVAIPPPEMIIRHRATVRYAPSHDDC